MVITPGTGTLCIASPCEAVRVLVRPLLLRARAPRVRQRMVRWWRVAQRPGHDAVCPTGPPADFAVVPEAVAVRARSCPPGFFFVG